MLATIEDLTIARADELFSNKYWIKDKAAIYYAFGLGPKPLVPDIANKEVLNVLLDKWYYLEVMSEYYVLIQSVFTNMGRMHEGRTIAGAWLKELASHSFDPIAFSACIDFMKSYTLELLHDVSPNVRTKTVKKFTRSLKHRWIINPWLVLFVQAVNRGDSSVTEVHAIRQLSEYLGRTLFTSTFNQLKKSAVYDYISYERELQTYEYSDEVVHELASKISLLLPENLWIEEMQDCVPSNSGGAPSGASRTDGAHIWYKYTHMHVDARLFRGFPGEPRTLFPLAKFTKRLVRSCELCAVPKTATSIRWISKEPPVLSYLQHAVQRALVNVLSKTSRKHLDFSDADRSGKLALKGSLFGDYATIDLSNASDSVTWKLVSRIFPPYVRKLLWATRSDSVVLPTTEGCPKTIKLAKFAPMGSAVCFPVESIVFLACILVAEDHYNQNRNGKRKTKSIVYGDDMVVEEWLVPDVFDVLETCHFRINKTKSFTGQRLNNFREACGEEAYNGFSIKPIRVSRNRYQASTLNPGAALSGLVSRYNNSVCFFVELAQLFIRRLRNECFENVPVLHQIGWGGTRLTTCSAPFNRNRVWDSDLQRWYVPTLAVKPVKSKINQMTDSELAEFGLSVQDYEDILYFEGLRKMAAQCTPDPWILEKQSEYEIQIDSIICRSLSPEIPWGI